MTWKEILKISTEDAISDAERFASNEVIDASRQLLIDALVEKGLESSEVISDLTEMAFSPKGKEPERMYDRHFYFLIIRPAGKGLIAHVPKVGDAGKYDRIVIDTVKVAREVADLYLKRHQKAVDTYKR